MIYIADDHEDSGAHLTRLTRRSGFDPSLFTSGTDLLKGLSQSLPRLVILDMMMPETTGLQCLRPIRATPSIAAVPVIT